MLGFNSSIPSNNPQRDFGARVGEPSIKTAAFIAAVFMLYYSRTFGYPPSDSELPQGSGYSGAVKANPDWQDKTLQSDI